MGGGVTASARPSSTRAPPPLHPLSSASTRCPVRGGPPTPLLPSTRPLPEDGSCASRPPLWSSATGLAATLLPLPTSLPRTTPLTLASPPSALPPLSARHHGVASPRQTLPPAHLLAPPLPHASPLVQVPGLHRLFVVMFKSSASLPTATLPSG